MTGVCGADYSVCVLISRSRGERLLRWQPELRLLISRLLNKEFILDKWEGSLQTRPFRVEEEEGTEVKSNGLADY